MDLYHKKVTSTINARKMVIISDWYVIGSTQISVSYTHLDVYKRQVQLPHDWSVELDFDEKAGGASGYLPGGIGWYRKSFMLSLIHISIHYNIFHTNIVKSIFIPLGKFSFDLYIFKWKIG